MTEQAKLYLTAKELQQRLRVAPATLRRGVAAGNILPPVRLGRLLRWPVAAVEAWEKRLSDAA